MNFRFVLLDGTSGRACAHWIKEPPVTVGRDPTVDLLINDPSISRRHCQFTLDAGGSLVVRDLGSTNGVYVDQERVSRCTVRPGVVVQIGAVSLRPEWTEDDVTEHQTSIDVIDLGETQPVKIVDPDQ